MMKPNNNNNMWQQLRNFIYPQSFPGSVGLPVQIYQKPIPSHFITNYPTTQLALGGDGPNRRKDRVRVFNYDT